MANGPLGGPRPFVRDETLKMVASMTNKSLFNETNFRSILIRSEAEFVKPVDTRMVNINTVAVDTGHKILTVEEVNNMKSAIREAIEATGPSVDGKIAISTQNVGTTEDLHS